MTALLDLGIIVRSPAWYRFFGAGEGMARLSSGDSLFPAVATAGIATGLEVAACCGLSGADVLRPLPWLRPVLDLIAAVFLAPGHLGAPVVLLGADPYLAELRGRWLFMVDTLVVSLALGLGYSAGAALAGPSPAPGRDVTS